MMHAPLPSRNIHNEVAWLIVVLFTAYSKSMGDEWWSQHGIGGRGIEGEVNITWFPDRKQTARVARAGNSHRWGDTVVQEVAVASAMSGSGGGVVAVLLFRPWLLVRPVGGWLLVVGWWGNKIQSEIQSENLLNFYSESRRFCSVFWLCIFCWRVMTSEWNTEWNTERNTEKKTLDRTSLI